jgi:hypothetical protein
MTRVVSIATIKLFMLRRASARRVFVTAARSTSVLRPILPKIRFDAYATKGYNISVGGGVRAARIVELLFEFDYVGSGMEKEYPYLQRDRDVKLNSIL